MKKEELKHEIDRKHAARSERRHNAKKRKHTPPKFPEEGEVMEEGMVECDSCNSHVEEDQFCMCCNVCWDCCRGTDHECAGEEDGCECPCCNKEEL